MAQILDGKKFAGEIRQEVKAAAEQLRVEQGIVPGLAVVLVGEDPASEVYVRHKIKACAEVGFASRVCRLDATTPEAAVAAQIAALNADDAVDGILVQLPLPKGLPSDRLLRGIDPAKDVDGLHPLNAGSLFLGQNRLVPCTPAGIIRLLQRYEVALAGKQAVVLGRSNIVGKPIALLLLQQNATVTVCHSRTTDLAQITRQADILVAAIGQPEFVTAEMVKPGAVVVDVGMNRVGRSLVGDVDFAGVSARAGLITPVPGGVGPLTIAMLLQNTLQAARDRRDGR